MCFRNVFWLAVLTLAFFPYFQLKAEKIEIVAFQIYDF